MADFKRRLACLEGRSGIGCPDCGHSPGASPDEYDVVWHDGADTGDFGEEGGPEFCASCGRQTTFIVGWEDLEGYDREAPDRGEGGR